MKKTTVYLEDGAAERLRDLAVRTGKPQAELIREGVRRILSETPAYLLGSSLTGGGLDMPAQAVAGADATSHDEAPKRTFHSMGMGEYAGDASPHWTSAELYAKVFRERIADEHGANR